MLKDLGKNLEKLVNGEITSFDCKGYTISKEKDMEVNDSITYKINITDNDNTYFVGFLTKYIDRETYYIPIELELIHTMHELEIKKDDKDLKVGMDKLLSSEIKSFEFRNHTISLDRKPLSNPYKHVTTIFVDGKEVDTLSTHEEENRYYLNLKHEILNKIKELESGN